MILRDSDSDEEWMPSDKHYEEFEDEVIADNTLPMTNSSKKDNRPITHSKRKTPPNMITNPAKKSNAAFPCEICLKNFTRKDNMQKHQKKFH